MRRAGADKKCKLHATNQGISTRHGTVVRLHVAPIMTGHAPRMLPNPGGEGAVLLESSSRTSGTHPENPHYESATYRSGTNPPGFCRPCLRGATWKISRQLLKAKQYSAVLERSDSYLAKTPKDAQVMFVRALALVELGRSDDAIKAFTALSDAYPQLPEPI